MSTQSNCRVTSFLLSLRQRHEKKKTRSKCFIYYMIGRQSRIVFSLCQRANKEATTTAITTSTWLRDERHTTSVFFCARHRAIHHQMNTHATCMCTTDGESKRIRCAVRSPARMPLSIPARSFHRPSRHYRPHHRVHEMCVALYTVCRCLFRWLIARPSTARRGYAANRARNGKQRAACISLHPMQLLFPQSDSRDGNSERAVRLRW